MKYILLSDRPALAALLKCLTQAHRGHRLMIVLFSEDPQDHLVKTIFKDHIKDAYALKDRFSYTTRTAKVYIIYFNKSTRAQLLKCKDQIYENLYLGAQDLSFLDAEMNVLFHSVTHENLWYVRDDLYAWSASIFTPVVKADKLFCIDQSWRLKAKS
jgi:hypothetical protein